MNEIRIYHSAWKMAIYIIGCFVFVASGWYVICNPRNYLDIFMGWLGVLFFGMGGLMLLYLAIKEFLLRNPYLTITDKSIIARSLTTKEYLLEDIDYFEYQRALKLIGIHYKKGIGRRKMKEASIIGRFVRKMNVEFLNTQEALSAYGLSMEPEDLCELLNSRLR